MLLEILIMGALMGILGQGARAVVGLKGMSDDAKAQGLSPNDLFEAGRLLTSFLIGIVVGLASVLVYLKSGGSATADPTWQTLLAWAVSAYAGTDFLEGFISQYLSPGVQTKKPQISIDDLTTQLALKLPAAPLDPAKVVNTAFVQDGKPNNLPTGTVLTDPPIKYTEWTDYVALGERINAQLNSTYWLSQTTALSWQAKGTTVGTVINAVQVALAHPHAPIPAGAPVA
jgi:hypothetical protein